MSSKAAHRHGAGSVNLQRAHLRGDSAVSRASLSAALLNPTSVALVGASDNPGSTAARPQLYLQRAGYSGRVYPINPRRTTVLGVQAWPSLGSLPEVPEHVFVLTPTDSVLPIVEECGKLGVKVVTVLASGFAEVGPDGEAREARLRDTARHYGVRLLGPSSIGVVNQQHGLLLTANAAFAEPELPLGRIFVASHSGSMIGALVSRGKERGIGFAGLVSVGSEADLSLGEVCMSTLDDPDIDGYVFFLESLRHGDALRRFALAAAERGKPIVAYKLGRSEAAAEMAATHTGALAGEDDVADAFLKGCGICRVGVLDALLETLPLARRIPLGNRSKRVGVVTTTGGGAAMVVDQLGLRGVDVTPPSPGLLARLRDLGIDVVPGRVVDLTMAGVRYEVMKAALTTMLDSGEFDLVLVAIGSSARFQPELAVKPLVDSAASATPFAAMLVPDAPEALAALTRAGIPCYRQPEACADSIAAVFARLPASALAEVPQASAGDRATRARFLDEAAAYELLDRVGLPRAPLATAPLAGPAPKLPFDYPVVAKICSEHIQHKTEVGGVILPIDTPAQLQAAFSQLRANLAEKAPGLPCDTVLVQPFCKGLAEVLLGYRVDPDAGPIVMLAAGGIWAEVFQDRSIRLAPVDLDTARSMIDEVRLLRTVQGLRGRPRGDIDALARAIVSLSKLAERPELVVIDAEVNPLLVLPEGEGVMAIDALVKAGRG